jgi:hypothetical protein
MSPRISIFILLISFFIHSATHAEDRLQQLTKRIEELEKQQEELLLNSFENAPRVNSFFNDKFTLGGFFEPSYTIIAGPDTELQAGSNSHLFGLNFAAEYTSKIRFVGQFITALTAPLGNEHSDPRAPSVSANLPERREFAEYNAASLLTQGYAEYSINQSFRIQTGLGYVPFGHYAQLREPVLFMRRNGPQFLSIKNLFTPLWLGVNLVGTLSKQNAGFNIYTAPSINQSQRPGLGLRVWKRSTDDHLTFGVSSQLGREGTNRYEVLGADLAIEYSTFKIITEYITQIYEGEKPWSLVVSPSFSIYKQEVLLYFFGDYASATKNITGIGTNAIPDPYSKWEYGGGINWLPTSFTRYRVGVTFHDYVGGSDTILGQARDYTSLDFSVGVTF